MANTGAGVPRHFQFVTQIYLVMATLIALAASIGAVAEYESGPKSTLVFASISVACSGILFLSFSVELLYNLCENNKVCECATTCLKPILEKLKNMDVPNKGVHCAVQIVTIGIVSICAIKMHEETWDWQFILCAVLLATVVYYNLFYTPCWLLSIAMYSSLLESEKRVIDETFKSAPFVWKKSYVDERLMPAAI